MEAFEAILTRRSTRKYTDVVLEKELIEKVIEAGRYAPSGHNNQTTHFMIFTDKAVLDELAGLVQAEFAKMDKTDDMYISLQRCIVASKRGSFVFHYGAPVFIAVSAFAAAFISLGTIKSISASECLNSGME